MTPDPVTQLEALQAKWLKAADKAMEYAGVTGFGGGHRAAPLRECADDLQPILDALRGRREEEAEAARHVESVNVASPPVPQRKPESQS